MQVTYLRREKSFDLNLLRAHQAQQQHAQQFDAVTAAATESTSGSLPTRSEFQQELMDATGDCRHGRGAKSPANDSPQRQSSKLPVPRSRQLQQPQLLSPVDLDKRMYDPDDG